MTKLIKLCLGLFFLTSLAFAQQPAQKDLEGSWKITVFASHGITVDIPTGKVSLSPEMEASLPAEQQKELEESMKSQMDMLKAGYIKFTGTEVAITMGPEQQKGQLLMKEGKTLVAFKADNGTPVELDATIVNKKLYLRHGSGAEATELIYTRQ